MNQPQEQRRLSPQLSLAVASLEIARAQADHDAVTFRAQGTCMYPTIRPGDVLRVRYCAVEDIAVGDIAVCRVSDHLFGHRVIATVVQDGRDYIITRPDRSREGGDAPAFGDGILGVVVGIERRGVPVSTEESRSSWVSKSYYHARLALIEAAPALRQRLVVAVARLQDRALYRRIATHSFSRAPSRLRFKVRVPLNKTLGDGVVRELEPAAFDPEAPWNGRSVDRWIIAALRDGSRVPAGSIGAVRGPDGIWQLEEPVVRARYRGMGLDDALVSEAGSVVSRASGAISAGAGKAEEPCDESPGGGS